MNTTSSNHATSSRLPLLLLVLAVLVGCDAVDDTLSDAEVLTQLCPNCIGIQVVAKPAPDAICQSIFISDEVDINMNDNLHMMQLPIYTIENMKDTNFKNIYEVNSDNRFVRIESSDFDPDTNHFYARTPIVFRKGRQIVTCQSGVGNTYYELRGRDRYYEPQNKIDLSKAIYVSIVSKDVYRSSHSSRDIPYPFNSQGESVSNESGEAQTNVEVPSTTKLNEPTTCDELTLSALAVDYANDPRAKELVPGIGQSALALFDKEGSILLGEFDTAAYGRIGLTDCNGDPVRIDTPVKAELVFDSDIQPGVEVPVFKIDTDFNDNLIWRQVATVVVEQQGTQRSVTFDAPESAAYLVGSFAPAIQGQPVTLSHPVPGSKYMFLREDGAEVKNGTGTVYNRTLHVPDSTVPLNLRLTHPNGATFDTPVGHGGGRVDVPAAFYDIGFRYEIDATVEAKAYCQGEYENLVQQIHPTLAVTPEMGPDWSYPIIFGQSVAETSFTLGREYTARMPIGKRTREHTFKMIPRDEPYETTSAEGTFTTEVKEVMKAGQRSLRIILKASLTKGNGFC